MVAPQHAHAPRRALPALAERDYEQEEAGATSQDWISLRAEGGGRGGRFDAGRQATPGFDCRASEAEKEGSTVCRICLTVGLSD